MKNLLTLLLLCVAPLSLCLLVSPASAVDFKAKGFWQFGFTMGDNNMVNKIGNRQVSAADKFHARQRLRLQLDAVASETLSGTVYFEIGNQMWGATNSGASLGTDGTVVKVRHAYIDWMVPNTELKLRMGIQDMSLPRKAGGGMVMDTMDAPAITASYRINDTASVTAFWTRPFNDNYQGWQPDKTQKSDAGYLDNIDLFGLTLPLRFDGFDISPWVMYGMRGKNTFPVDQNGKNQKIWMDGLPQYTFSSNPFYGYNFTGKTDKAYGNMFWAGLPMGITAFAPWNIELDINYGYVEAMGNYDIASRGTNKERASTKREGWLAMALVEYALDWGKPGLFGWYGSGDDGNLKNGSERMPSVDPWAKFTSYTGAANFYPHGYNDLVSNYSGTWGLGLRVRDVSFVEKLTHVVRVAYWGGTNSTSMVKYARSRDAWNYGVTNLPNKAGIYMTTADAMVEFNLDSYYKIYDNLTVGLETGYLLNNFDANTWQKDSRSYLGPSMSLKDAWHATMYVAYTF